LNVTAGAQEIILGLGVLVAQAPVRIARAESPGEAVTSSTNWR
jgi:hypothetical protein